jgi:hypothetical protein|tara:strand:- start:2934 stop:3173 length:240 start_codon:yes stop_codon:yes gene_type:complete
MMKLKSQQLDEELYEIVKEAIEDYGDIELVTQMIQEANLGRPRGFVNNENLHLFRVYRNSVSSDASVLVNQVLVVLATA